ncbi:DNA helicase [Bacillus cereus]|nr:hypothetical protein bcere0029_10040 [Bacillus cereus AH1272]EEL94895.1 hypothetical protein bcere0030_10020 [Bacillus cereus AH1273]PEB82700.1 DNA helicase [Bacillus cereus]PEW90194.1 DNA helicase [Bacillus cereus]PFN74381.1 DNA helicase [Bacillus cereus]
MVEIIPEKTLKKIEKDIENNNLGKARDRVHGLIATYPNELELRKKLGDIYFTLQYPEMAGRYWYLEKEKTDVMHAACRQFEKSMGNDPYHIVRALKFKGDHDIITGLHTEHPLQKKVVEKLIDDDDDEETWKDKLFVWGCLALFAFLLFTATIGIFTIVNWIL